jgi:hypothetical protein
MSNDINIKGFVSDQFPPPRQWTEINQTAEAFSEIMGRVRWNAGERAVFARGRQLASAFPDEIVIAAGTWRLMVADGRAQAASC